MFLCLPQQSRVAWLRHPAFNDEDDVLSHHRSAIDLCCSPCDAWQPQKFDRRRLQRLYFGYSSPTRTRLCGEVYLGLREALPPQLTFQIMQIPVSWASFHKGSLDLVQALLDLDFDRPGRQTRTMDLGRRLWVPSWLTSTHR